MKEKILQAIHTDCDSMNAEDLRSEIEFERNVSWVSYTEISLENE